MNDEHTQSVERFTISLPQHLAKRIEEHWHNNHLPSRSEAVRHLVELGFQRAADEELSE